MTNAIPPTAWLAHIPHWQARFAADLLRHDPQLCVADLELTVRQALIHALFKHICATRGITYDPQAATLHPSVAAATLHAFEQSLVAFDTGGGDVLGQVYERMLSTTLSIVDDGGVQVRDVPMARRGSGVYYTPAYIVEYMVDAVLAPLLADKTPADVAHVRILDPTCGSGAFLLGAYEYLLHWHLDWYLAHDPQTWAAQPNAPIAQFSTFTLSYAERERILRNCIYGVDLDPQAVEVTRLGLLLMLWDAPSVVPMELPDLPNLCCGNALVGPDVYGTRYFAVLAANEQGQLKPFAWQAAFPAVFARGGFDVVLGNPPYSAALFPPIRAYLAHTFAAGTTDTAALLMLQALHLTKQDGWNAFIVPKAWTYSSNWQVLRERLREPLDRLIDVGKVWPAVKLEQVIYVLQKGASPEHYASLRRDGQRIVPLATVDKRDCVRWGFLLNGLGDADVALGRKVRGEYPLLGTFVINTRGAMLQRMIDPHGNGWRVIGGKQVQRWALVGAKGWLDPAAAVPEQARVRPGSLVVQNIVAHVTQPYDHIKIIGTLIGEHEADVVLLDTVNQLTNHGPLSNQYLLGLLHSKLLNWYVYRFIFAQAVRTMHFDGPVTDRMPIRPIHSDDPRDVAQHRHLVALVDEMLHMHRQAACDHVRSAALMREIDQVVYALYDLTDDEIALVEGSDTNRGKTNDGC